MRNLPDSREEYEDGLFTLDDALRRIRELEERVSLLEDPSKRVKFPTRKRRGPKNRIGQQELIERRDKLIYWVERCWPMLSVALPRAATPDEAMNAMMRAAKESPRLFMPPFYEHLGDFADELWGFLRSNRYRGNPRNLCSAMAGLPEISWKRSFDICSRIPSRVIMQSEAYRDYLRRKFPDRLHELDRAETTDQVIAVLRKSQSKDLHYQRLKENPDKALNWLRLGKPT